MNESRFRDLVEELGSENPLAIRPFLRLLEIRFTTEVPTLAVTCEERPSLLVNGDFLDQHCRKDDHVKAVILHEYLHILLRHTEKRGPITPAEHLATDAVINAIIHRQAGSRLSSMMAKYYARAGGLHRLLRRMTETEQATAEREYEDPFWLVWKALYDGSLVVDDIREIAEQLTQKIDIGVVERLIGNHSEDDEPQQSTPIGALAEALDEALRAMNGDGVWRSPRDRGIGANEYETAVEGKNEAIEQWKRKTMQVLRKHVIPDSRSRLTENHPLAYMLPVLSTGDRRAFVRAMWSPFLPEASWSTAVARPVGCARIYLDVSGSMNAEMPLIVALLASLRRYIPMPFWAFSTEVAPATIRNGVLVTKTTGGTSIECVLRHIATTRPQSAVIVTDGYIEPVEKVWAKLAGNTRLHAIVTRDGSTDLLDRGGIPCSQLERVP